MDAGCPILPGYRTAASSAELWLSDSFVLSDNLIIVQGLVVRFCRVIGQPHHQPSSGCPILLGYRTTSSSSRAWLSDSSGLSDSHIIVQGLVVRFFRVIGQPHHRPRPGCPILPGYRTATSSSRAWLSDSSGLSDNLIIVQGLIVRFFRIIGQSVSMNARINKVNSILFA